MKWVVQYNAHRYQDHSDVPVLRQRTFSADSAEEAQDLAFAWRVKANELALDGQRRTYVGLLHLPATLQDVGGIMTANNPPLRAVRAIGSNMTEVEHGDLTILYSYKTPVLFHDREFGGFFLTEQHHSGTTSKHIGKYLRDVWGQDAASIKAMQRLPQADIEAAAQAGQFWTLRSNPDVPRKGQPWTTKSLEQHAADVRRIERHAQRVSEAAEARGDDDDEDCEQYFMVLVDNHYGIYQGRELADRADWKGVDKKTLRILRKGPAHEHYMEAWDDLMSNGVFEDGGHEWRAISGPSGDILAYADDTPDGCMEW